MPAASTVRFVELVEHGGAPEVHLSWVAPAKDPDLQRAIKQHRLVTVHQHARGPKDFGVVGFDPAPDAQFFVFPRSLRSFAGRKVIGIKYELLHDTTTHVAAASRTTPKPQKPKSTQSPAKTPKPDPPKKSLSRPAPPEPEADFITDTDPVKREVRKALIALSAGRTAEAKRRLQAILANDVRD